MSRSGRFVNVAVVPKTAKSRSDFGPFVMATGISEDSGGGGVRGRVGSCPAFPRTHHGVVFLTSFVSRVRSGCSRHVSVGEGCVI